MIEITGIDLVEFTKKVYEFSSPQGMGFLHFTPNPLTTEDANQFIDIEGLRKRTSLQNDCMARKRNINDKR